MDTKHSNTTHLELSENAVAVLKKRYLKKNEAGEAIEEPIDMFRRVAATIADADTTFASGRLSAEELKNSFFDKYDAFLHIMVSRKFMPNSPTLMNAGSGPGSALSVFRLAGRGLYRLDLRHAQASSHYP